MKSLVISCVLFAVITLSKGNFLFTNLKCEEFDKPFATIPICRLKLVERGVSALYILVKLHQIPVKNITINLEFLKKANGFRPFLYNHTVNFCDAMKYGRKFPVVHIITSLLARDSNINHTCPYNHDIEVKRLVLRDEMFRLMPLPSGDYLINFRVAAYNDWKALVKLYVAVKE